jgi:hypothetical protein
MACPSSFAASGLNAHGSMTSRARICSLSSLASASRRNSEVDCGLRQPLTCQPSAKYGLANSNPSPIGPRY